MQAHTPHPLTVQRALVLSIVGLLAVTGLVLGMALGDACAKYGGDAALALVGKKCDDLVTWQDYLPGRSGWIALGGFVAANVLAYELRWYLRVHGVAAVGALYVCLAGVIAVDGLPLPLVIFYAVFGVAMVAAAWGIRRDRREGWAAALAMLAVLLTSHFFGSAKIADETGMPMAYAVLPSMGLFLPLVIVLTTTSPGTPRARPFERHKAVPAAPAPA
jgi:hypothetical protein